MLSSTTLDGANYWQGIQRDTFKTEKVSPVPRIIIANNKDSYSSKAEEDSFGFTSGRATAAAEADILFLLVPDQVVPPSLLKYPKKLNVLRSTQILRRIPCAHSQRDSLHSCCQWLRCFLQVPQCRSLERHRLGRPADDRYESGQGFPCFVRRAR
ncbi:uncharacterized protein K441DRAFT_62039 [Cenococcum geophilum 1.58]|uniref:uncharacterized protein n=1 Tax=Cenococcum geophilum 1.58 TaxID=794803 RepID=UPI00358E8462|nr:hypothetical protein K441DRAFT_62039 [Cenococcum geophilum 1.58]